MTGSAAQVVFDTGTRIIDTCLRTGLSSPWILVKPCQSVPSRCIFVIMSLHNFIREGGRRGERERKGERERDAKKKKEKRRVEEIG